MRGQMRFFRLTGDRRRDYRGTEFIADIILYNKYGSHAALFGTYYGTEIRIIDVASLYVHGLIVLSVFCGKSFVLDFRVVIHRFPTPALIFLP
jgi:hypothetical protein